MVTLSGSNSFSGGVNLSGQSAYKIAGASSLAGSGTLWMGHVNNNPMPSIENTSGSTLTLGYSDYRINGNAGGGNLILSGSNWDFGSGTVTLTGHRRVDIDSAQVRWGGALNGNFNLEKRGAGTLILASDSTRNGQTKIRDGVLLVQSAGALGSGSLMLAGYQNSPYGGGILGIGADMNGAAAGDFTYALDPSSDPPTAGTLRFGGSGGFSAWGGFAAYGANRVVNIGGSGAALTWSQTNFVSGGFFLGSATSTHTLDFQNPLSLSNSARTVYVGSGSAVVDGHLSGAVSNTHTNGTLTLLGGGTLQLSNSNTYTGKTYINDARLLLTNSAGNSGTGTGEVNVGVGGGTEGVIAGTGVAFGKTIVINGHIAPGALTSNTGNLGSAGTLRLGVGGTINLVNATTGLTLTQAILDLDLSPSAVSGNDRIVTAGALSLANVAVVINPLTAGVLDSSQPYTLISGAASVTGFDANALAAATTFTSGDYSPTYSLSGNDLQVSFTLIPEPGSAALLMLGGLLALRRRR